MSGKTVSVPKAFPLGTSVFTGPPDHANLMPDRIYQGIAKLHGDAAVSVAISREAVVVVDGETLTIQQPERIVPMSSHSPNGTLRAAVGSIQRIRPGKPRSEIKLDIDPVKFDASTFVEGQIEKAMKQAFASGIALFIVAEYDGDMSRMGEAVPVFVARIMMELNRHLEENAAERVKRAIIASLSGKENEDKDLDTGYPF